MTKKIGYISLTFGIILLLFFFLYIISPTSATNIDNTNLPKGSSVVLDITNVTTDETNFNRYTVNYVSNVFIKGVIEYKRDNIIEKERFFLEPSNAGVFSSFINGYIDDISINENDLVSIYFENIDDNTGTFTVNSINLSLYPTVNELVASISGILADSDYNSQQTVFIGNNNIKLGLSLKYGGSINYISGDEDIFSSNYSNVNLINRYDNGRLIQQAVYGNRYYLEDNEPYVTGESDNIGGMYNPIQGGNIDYDSKIVDIGISSDKKTIVIKTKPSLWRITNENYIEEYYDYYEGYTTDSYMLTEYKIYDTYIEVSNSYIDFTDNVNDTDNGHSRSESPAVYTISALDKFYYYTIANKTLTQATIGTINSSGFKALNPDANNNGQAIYSYWGGYFSTNGDITEGLGIYHPTYDGAHQYLHGFVAGETTSKSSMDETTSFFAPIIHLNGGKLQQFKKFDYSYVITLGNINNTTAIMNAYRTDHGYALKVDPNGGKFLNSENPTTMNEKLLAYWGNWNTIAISTRNGYTLLGYYDSKTSGTKVYDSNGVAINSKYWKVNTGTLVEEKYQYIGNKDLTVYAQWKPINYTITYDLDGGNVSGNPTTYTVENTITLKNPTKLGYTFVGWTGTDLNNASTNVVINEGTTGNRSYKALWIETKYIVTFNAQGGVISGNNQIETTNGMIDMIPSATRSGYTFDGWYTSNNEKVMENTKITEDITLYAKWQAINYTISYDLDGGNVTGNPSTYTIESSDITLKNPIKDNYTFLGWLETGSDTPVLNVVIPKGTIGNKNYKATWTLKTYTITFNGNGGILNDENEKISNNGMIGTMPVPTRSGYSFLGWFTESDDKVEETTKVTANITLYAKWKIENYNISYDLDGGSVTGNPSTYTVESNDITLKNPTKEGYTFLGWIGSNIDTPTLSVVIKKGNVGNRNYKATWTETKYNVKFNANGGIIDGELETITDNGLIKEFPTVTRKGYNFIGWYNNDEKITETTKISSDVTLIAKWNLIEYKISYDLDGGSVTGNPSIYTIESNDITLKNPIKEGHTFDGWIGTGLANAELSVVIKKGTTGNLSYKATWSETKYKITFNPNGGTLEGSSEITTNMGMIGTLPKIKKEGYTFLGWYTKADVKVSETTKINQDIDLYAKWNAVIYNISYDLDGGSVTGNPSTYTIESNDITLKNPTKEGFTFLGWIGSGLSSPINYVTIYKGSVGNRNYKATWTPINFTIIFNANGGIIDGNSQTITTDGMVGKMPSVTKKGYTFLGWYINGNQKVSETTKVTSNLTLTAKWQINEYTITYDLDGGSVTGNPLKYNVESNEIQIVKPNKSGFTFIGWIGSGLTTPVINLVIPKGSTGDRAYKATWTYTNYKIYYNPNGGIIEGNNVSDSAEGKIGSMPIPKKEGYTFSGWYTNNDEKVTEMTKIYSDIELTAKWQINEYTITYDLAGGSVTGNPLKYNVETDEFTLVNPTKKDFKFAGWIGTDLKNSTSIVKIPKGTVGNRNYKATWIKDGYIIILDVSGGVLSNVSQIITKDGVIEEFPIPTKKGYEFAGWYNEAGEAVTETTKFSSDSTIYAKWKIIEYTIRYNLNGGFVSNNPTVYNVTSKTFKINNPTKENYKFTGWKDEATGVISNKIQINEGTIGNKIYTALFSKIVDNQIPNKPQDDEVINPPIDEEVSPPDDENDIPDDNQPNDNKPNNNQLKEKNNSLLKFGLIALIILVISSIIGVIVYNKRKHNEV